MREIENFDKLACQNMVAMETSSHVDRNLSYKIVVKYILEKVAKFGSACFNIKKKNGINVQSRHGQNSTHPPICIGLR